MNDRGECLSMIEDESCICRAAETVTCETNLSRKKGNHFWAQKLQGGRSHPTTYLIACVRIMKGLRHCIQKKGKCFFQRILNRLVSSN